MGRRAVWKWRVDWYVKCIITGLCIGRFCLKPLILMPIYFKLSIYRSRYTWRTGAGTRKGSRKARGVRSWLRQSAKCARIDSTEWRGCCRVTRKYFCSARAIEGNTAWAASCGSIGIAGTVSKQSHAVNSTVMFPMHKTCFFCENWIQKRQGLTVPSF